MAIYHLSAKMIKRSDGRSSVAAAAYRSGSALHDERQNLTFNYEQKENVLYDEILLPQNAPKEFSKRENLWNAVEKKETRKNSQTAREIEVALPRELNLEQQKKLVRNFVQKNFIDVGMCADFAIHTTRDDNPHAHIMLTTREIDETGFTVKNRDWNNKELLKSWRKEWEVVVNNELEKNQIEERVSCESFDTLGIVDKKPQLHVGVVAMSIERKEMKKCEVENREYKPVTNRMQKNEEIKEHNKLIDKAKEQLRKAKEKIKTELNKALAKLKGKEEKIRNQIEEEQQKEKQEELGGTYDENGFLRPLSEKQLEQYVPAELAEVVPGEFETDDIPVMERKVYAHYFLNGSDGFNDSYMFEYNANNQDGLGVVVNSAFCELGYFSLAEFEYIKNKEGVKLEIKKYDEPKEFGQLVSENFNDLQDRIKTNTYLQGEFEKWQKAHEVKETIKVEPVKEEQIEQNAPVVETQQQPVSAPSARPQEETPAQKPVEQEEKTIQIPTEDYHKIQAFEQAIATFDIDNFTADTDMLETEYNPLTSQFNELLNKGYHGVISLGTRQKMNLIADRAHKVYLEIERRNRVRNR